MHDSPWLRGQYAPVDDELSIAALRVTGALPEGLRGAFLRNGPNPQFPPIGRYHLFDGDGMIHGVTFDGEGGASYANRWVRSAGFEAERAAGRALFGGLSEFAMPPDDIFARVGPIKNTANTHIVSHAGHLLALMEGLGPIEVADDLTTIGPFDFDGRLAGSMTAHPKTDPVTGEMVFFGYSPVAPYLRVYSSDRSGELTWSTVVELPGPVMMHDFVVTESRVVIFDLPAVFDLHALLRGETAIFWDPARGARVGVLDRGAPGSSVRWIDVDPFWVFHFFNAHDEPDGSIAVTGCRAERLNTTFDGSELTDGYRPSVWRWTIGAEATSFGATQLDDAPTDFPRIDERRTGLDNRIGYSGHAARWSGDEVVFDGVKRYDLRTGSSEYRRFGANVTCGETVFAPDPDDPAEGSGWLLSFVHDHDADESMVAVLDAPTLEPVATVHLPRRVPFGFHGSYVAASAS